MKYIRAGLEKNNEKMTTANILFAWLFLTILPQMIFQNARVSSANVALKVVFLAGFLFVVFIYLYRKKARANLMEVVMAFVFCLLQMTSDYFVGGHPITFSSVVTTATSTIYYLLFFGLMYNEKIDNKGIYRIAFLFDLFILIAAGYNIMQYGSAMLNVFSISNSYEMVMRSFFTNRNTFAIYLMYSVVLCAFRLANSTEKKKKSWYWFILAISGYCLFCTFSRTSTLAMAVCLFVYFAGRKKGQITKRTTIIAAALLLVVFVLYATGAYQFILDMLIRPETGSTGRVDRWEILLGKFFDGNVLFGGHSDNTIMPHNTYVNMLLMGGFALFFFYWALYLKVFKKIVYILKHDREHGTFLFGMYLAFIGISSMTESIMLVTSTANSVVNTLFVLILPHYYYNYLVDEEKKALESKEAFQSEENIITEGIEGR